MLTLTPNPHPPSSLRLPLTILLAVTATPLALAAWIMLSGGQRAAYLRSGWVRLGAVVLAAGALPLLAVGGLAAIGLWPDPNPNPVGLGLLFFAAGVLACILILIGVLRVALRDDET
jgi:hypothetical protein